MSCGGRPEGGARLVIYLRKEWKMAVPTVLILVYVLVSCTHGSESDKFVQWMMKFNKQYSPEERVKREAVFHSNVELIYRLNQLHEER